MSILPAFSAVLNDGLSDQECKKITDRIKSLDGVLSAAFRKATQDNPAEIWVTYMGNSPVQGQASAIPGVRTTRPLI
jgi:hypothetical protein